MIGINKKEVLNVLLFFDERKLTRNPLGQRWLYIGMLGIRKDDIEEALGKLLETRRGVDSEISYKNLKHRNRRGSTKKVQTALNWVYLVKNDNVKEFHFYILGLYWDNLATAFFANKENHVYRRFIISAIRYGVKTFFSNEAEYINVEFVFHDRSSMEKDPFFDWAALWLIEREDENIGFETSEIRFIDSDHRVETVYPRYSHFVQLIDIILGSTAQCLDGLSSHTAKMEVAEAIYPLVERLVDEKRYNNPRSRYNYRNRCLIRFFPSKFLREADFEDPYERATSRFFVGRDLLIRRLRGNRRNEQLGLF